MKKTKHFVIIALVLMALIFSLTIAMCAIAPGAPTVEKYSVEITGDDFTGSYLLTTESGRIRQASFEGQEHERLIFEGKSLTISAQKQTLDGELKIIIYLDGTLLDSAATSSPYGIVTISVP